MQCKGLQFSSGLSKNVNNNENFVFYYRVYLTQCIHLTVLSIVFLLVFWSKSSLFYTFQKSRRFYGCGSPYHTSYVLLVQVFMFLIPVALSRGGYTLWLHSRTPYGTHFIGLGIWELLATRSWELKDWLKTCGSKNATIFLYLFGQFLIGCLPIYSARQYMRTGSTLMLTLPKCPCLKGSMNRGV